MDATNKDNLDCDPFFDAICRGDRSIVEAMLKQGVSANSFDPVAMMSALDAAIENHQAAICTMLLDAGADMEKDNGWGTPLLHAIDIEGQHLVRARPADADMTSLLVSRGADVYRIDSGGLTPLELAKRLGHVKAVEVLTESGD